MMKTYNKISLFLNYWNQKFDMLKHYTIKNKMHKMATFKRLRPATLFKKETLVQVFSCEFCQISKDTFFTEHL